jgi:hypothetical protein
MADHCPPPPLAGCGWGGKGREAPKTLVKIQAPVEEQTVAKKNGGPANADGSSSSAGKSETDISR